MIVEAGGQDEKKASLFYCFAKRNKNKHITKLIQRISKALREELNLHSTNQQSRKGRAILVFNQSGTL